MKIYDIVTEDKIDEAPVSGIKQGLKKFGAKALAKVGAKDTAMGLAGQVDTGDEANKLRSEFQNYIGQTGQSMKQIDPADLAAWLKSKKYPTDAIEATSAIDKKSLDQILLKTVQLSKKVKGDQPQAPGQTAGAGKQDPKSAQAGQDGATQQQTDTTKVDKATATGSSSTAGGKAPPTQNGSAVGAAASIPPEIQAQLDLLNGPDKKRLASMI